MLPVSVVFFCADALLYWAITRRSVYILLAGSDAVALAAASLDLLLAISSIFSGAAGTKNS